MPKDNIERAIKKGQGGDAEIMTRCVTRAAGRAAWR